MKKGFQIDCCLGSLHEETMPRGKEEVEGCSESRSVGNWCV